MEHTDIRYIMPQNSDTPKKLLEITKDFLEVKNRRYFGKAASGLSNQLVDPKYKEFNISVKAVKAGIAGEESTSQILRKWIADKPNIVLIDSIHLKLGEESEEAEFDEEESQVNSLGDTDHLLIIGENIIIIDSKNWKEKASYSVLETGEVLRSKKEFTGNKPRILQSKYLWKKFYEENFPDLTVEAYVCIANPNSFIIRDRAWWAPKWKLVNQETLIYFLDKFYKEMCEDIDYIQVDLVAKALTGIQKPFNVYKAQFPTVYNLVKGKK